MAGLLVGTHVERAQALATLQHAQALVSPPSPASASGGESMVGPGTPGTLETKQGTNGEVGYNVRESAMDTAMASGNSRNPPLPNAPGWGPRVIG